MKKLFIVANWKSNKTVSEAKNWFRELSTFNFQPLTDREVIICPPFTLLSAISAEIKKNNLPFKLGAQDISQFESGAYSGEINGDQIKEFADYVIVGHSERRKYFKEDEKIILKKLEMAQKYNLVPILCISDIVQLNPLSFILNHQSAIVAYEPLFAIGSGKADNPENSEQVAHVIKDKVSEVPILYGGSITSNNVNNFTRKPNINGVLIGGASLSGLEFAKIIENA